MVQGSRHAQILQEEAVRQVETRRRMRQTVVPVIDADVRSTLRQLGEPITLFGEREVGDRIDHSECQHHVICGAFPLGA